MDCPEPFPVPHTSLPQLELSRPGVCLPVGTPLHHSLWTPSLCRAALEIPPLFTELLSPHWRKKRRGGGSLSRGCSEPNPCPSWAPAVPTPCCLPQDTGTSSLSSVGGLLPTPQPPTLVELSWVSHSVSGIPTQTSAYSLNLWPVHNASPPRIPPAPPCTQFPLSPHQIRCVSFSKCTGEQQPLRTVCWPYHMG